MDYLPKYAACRDIGHSWDYQEWYGDRRTLVCSNCDARRNDRLDHFSIVSRKYSYPTGYKWQHTPIHIRQLREQLSREARKLERWSKLPVLKTAKKSTNGKNEEL